MNQPQTSSLDANDPHAPDTRETGRNQLRTFTFPHSKLIACQLALELRELVAKTRISRTQLREQALKSAVSAGLNTGEATARQSRTDRSRVYAIAEAREACASVEIAGRLGACSASDIHATLALGCRLKDVLSRLVR